MSRDSDNQARGGEAEATRVADTVAAVRRLVAAYAATDDERPDAIRSTDDLYDRTTGLPR